MTASRNVLGAAPGAAFRGPRLALVAVALVALACARPRVVPEEPPRVAARGFAVRAPAGDTWHLLNREERAIAFARHVGEKGRFVTALARRDETAEPIRDAEALRAYTEALVRRELENAVERLEYQLEPSIRAGAPCTEVRFRGRDLTNLRNVRGPAVIVETHQVLCVHPQSRGTFLVLARVHQRYTERQARLDLGPEVAPFLEDIVFAPL